MKTLGIFAILLLLSSALFAQNRGAVVSSGGGARTTMAAPATQRSVGSVLYPAGAVPAVTAGSPFVNTSIGRVGPGRDRARVATRPGAFLYSYPVYVGGGGYYDSSYYGQQAPAATGQDQQPNVIVVYPPQQPPVIINQYGSGDAPYPTRVQPQNIYPSPAQAEEPSTGDAPHYLIAFKDHSIYSAVAYWVDGDTLHYFTTGSTHNQASVSLIDRELTERLNKESGAEVKLPPAK
jgi:hypothetical protein